MSWLIRLLLLSRTRQLFCECATFTLAEYGAGAPAKLRAEIDPGTPFSGRLMIWLMIAEVYRQARHRDTSLAHGAAPAAYAGVTSR